MGSLDRLKDTVARRLIQIIDRISYLGFRNKVLSSASTAINYNGHFVSLILV